MGIAPPIPADARMLIERLYRADPRLAIIEQGAGPLAWRQRARGFPGLLQAIMGQQISTAAASAIWRRFAALDGALDPAGLLALDPAALRMAGLSQSKIGTARSLALAFLSGALSDDLIAGAPDEQAIAAISAIPGLGRWTAEVFLLFAHERPDVFPSGDLALQAAAGHLLALPARPNAAALRHLANSWRPARALAARLLWHHWRHVTGRPTMDDADQRCRVAEK